MVDALVSVSFHDQHGAQMQSQQFAFFSSSLVNPVVSTPSTSGSSHPMDLSVGVPVVPTSATTSVPAAAATTC